MRGTAARLNPRPDGSAEADGALGCHPVQMGGGGRFQFGQAVGVLGQAAEACPVVLVRGAGLTPGEGGSRPLLRDREMDMFR